MPNGMLLAAGRGTRLGPLTEYVPKPLLPVANEPVMAQGIRALRAVDITTIGVNLCYRAEQILNTFDDGAAYDAALHWVVETEARGTAGGMKRLQHLLDDDLIVVVAGDAMLDVDLAPLLAAHRAAGAFASLATLAVEDPSRYGVVVADADGRLRAFQEKPAPGTELSRLANTGIYCFEPAIFDLIPVDEFCDFALHVFPRILQLGLPFYAFPAQGYWTDVGTPADYLQANLDFLAGRIRVPGDGVRVGANFLAADAVVEGELCECVVGARAIVPAGSTLTRCVVWPDAVLPAALTLDGAICTPHGIYTLDGLDARVLAPVG